MPYLTSDEYKFLNDYINNGLDYFISYLNEIKIGKVKLKEDEIKKLVFMTESIIHATSLVQLAKN